MRDPKRIDEFCAELARVWRKCPDLRFGQFMWSVLEGWGDLYYHEDDRILTLLHIFEDEELG